MADISQHIAPKSDQLNGDDLLAGDRIIHIREVKVLGVGKEQPIWIYFDGDGGRPWKPCKTMARLLANLWKSPDTSTWVGKSAHLYHDPEVTWAGAKVGGIRVRAVSHMDAPRQVAISESQKKRKLAVIGVIDADPRQTKPTEDGATRWANNYIAKVKAAATADELNAFANGKAAKLAELQSARADLHTRCVQTLDARRTELAPKSDGFDDDPFGDNDGTLSEDNPTGREGPADEQMGERHSDAEPPYLAGIQTLRDKLAAARTVKAVDAIDNEWCNTLRLTIEEVDSDLCATIDGEINTRRRALRDEARD